MVEWRRTQEYYDSSVWRDTWKVDDGDILMNQTIHSVDLLLWFMGDVTEVNVLSGIVANENNENIEVEDSAIVVVIFENGVVGFLAPTVQTTPSPLMRAEIKGDNGSVVIEDDEIAEWEFTNSAPEDAEILEAIENRPEEYDVLPDPTEIWKVSPAMQFKDVLDAIETGRKPLIDGYEGRKSVELFCAIYESVKTHGIVKLG
ncbi:MAG: Gfo/Idh/MocA family oxidoreductase [Thermoguttaceae bacterium]